MNNIKANKNRIAIIAFLVILCWVWVIGSFIYLFKHDFYVYTTETSGENRASAKIEYGELWSTGASISSFVDDRIPFRNIFIKIYKTGNEKIENVYHRGATKVGAFFYKPPEVEEVADKNTEEAVEPIEEVEEKKDSDLIIIDPNLPEDLGCYYAPVIVNDVLIGRRNFLFYYGENSMDYYMGTNLLDQETLELYAEKLRVLKELCDQKGKELYMIFPPNKDQVYPWLMPTLEPATDYKRTARLADYLCENTSVPVKYLLDAILEGDKYWEEYYKFDTHWNTIGAFHGTQALYSMMGVETTDPHDLNGEYHGAPNYDLAVMAGIDVTTIGDQGEYVVEYKNDITVEGVDLDSTVCRTTSDGINDKKFVFIGDSFRTAMIPYMTKDFTHCTIAHRNSINDIDSDIKDSDIIVIEAIERQDFEAFDVVDYLITLLQ